MSEERGSYDGTGTLKLLAKRSRATKNKKNAPKSKKVRGAPRKLTELEVANAGQLHVAGVSFEDIRTALNNARKQMRSPMPPVGRETIRMAVMQKMAEVAEEMFQGKARENMAKVLTRYENLVQAHWPMRDDPKSAKIILEVTQAFTDILKLAVAGEAASYPQAPAGSRRPIEIHVHEAAPPAPVQPAELPGGAPE